MSGESAKTTGISTSWPEIKADVKANRALAKRVGARVTEKVDHQALKMGTELTALTNRLDALERGEELTKLDLKTTEDQLRDLIEAQAAEMRRAKKGIEEMLLELQQSIAAADRRSDTLEREVLRLREENTELIELIDSIFGSLNVVTENVTGVQDSADARAKSLENELVDVRTANAELVEVLEGAFGSLDRLAEDLAGVRGVVDERDTAMLSRVSDRAQQLEREIAAVRAQLEADVSVVRGSVDDQSVEMESLVTTRVEELERTIAAMRLQFEADVSVVRGSVDDQGVEMEALISARAEQLEREIVELRGEVSEVQESTVELEKRYRELRDLIEEARVTAEKAADRADYASDGVSAIEADLDDELDALKQRLRDAPTDAELRSEFAAVARREVRNQAEQLEAIKAEIDLRLKSGLERESTGRPQRRWQGWIDLTERVDKD